MTSISDVQAQTWQAINPQIPANPDAAIYKSWLAHKAAYTGPLGIPVTLEQPVSEGGVAQGFSSGAIVWWTPSAGTKVL